MASWSLHQYGAPPLPAWLPMEPEKQYQGIRFNIKDFKVCPVKLHHATKILNQCILISNCAPGAYTIPLETGIHYLAIESSKWIKLIGFPSTYSDKHESIAMSSATIFAYMASNQDLFGKPSLTSVYFVFWLFTMDDVLDPMMEENRSGKAPMIRAAFASFMDIMTGAVTCIGDLTPNPLPYFESMCRVLMHAVQLMAIHFENFDANKEFLVKAVRDFLDSFLWRYERDNNGRDCSESTYIHFRAHYTGFYCMYELIALVNGVKVKAEERGNIEFIRYITATAAAMSVANDILSLKKEIEDGQTENFAMHKSVNKEISIGNALHECIEFVNKETHEASVYSARLLASGGSADLKKYIELVNASLEGHLRFYGFTKRYGDIEVQPITLSSKEYRALLHPLNTN